MKNKFLALFVAGVMFFKTEPISATSSDATQCLLIKSAPRCLLQHAYLLQIVIAYVKPTDEYCRTFKQQIVKGAVIELVKRMPNHWISNNQSEYIKLLTLLNSVNHEKEENFNEYGEKVIGIIKWQTSKSKYLLKKKINTFKCGADVGKIIGWFYERYNKIPKQQSTAIVVRTPSLSERIFEKLYNSKTILYKHVFAENNNPLYVLIRHNNKLLYTQHFAVPKIYFNYDTKLINNKKPSDMQ